MQGGKTEKKMQERKTEKRDKDVRVRGCSEEIKVRKANRDKPLSKVFSPSIIDVRTVLRGREASDFKVHGEAKKKFDYCLVWESLFIKLIKY